MPKISIIGAGLSGCEAALQLASHGFDVDLYDSKPLVVQPPYKLHTYAELVCNNVLGSKDANTPLGLLLSELKLLNSKLISIAERTQIEDPHFFAVDKQMFSQQVSLQLIDQNVNIVNSHIYSIPKSDYVIIATGPLTDEDTINMLSNYNIREYHFSDASSPVVDINSINLHSTAIKKITNDLYAVTISPQLFEEFADRLRCYATNRRVKGFENGIAFDKCKSIESLACESNDELFMQRFMYDHTPIPTLLLRRENSLRNGFILTGCMTTLKYSDQRAVFSILPGFENCTFIKYGRMHRNTFFNSPEILNEFYQLNGSNIFIVGQISGVDGYVPAISSGMVASMRIIYGDELKMIPRTTMIGALSYYISNSNVTDFQPMCASFSLLNNSGDYAQKSFSAINALKKELGMDP